MFKYFILLTILIVFQNCSDHKVEKAFYYWKTSFELSDSDIHYLNNAGVQKIYIKFFDIDWDETTLDPKQVGSLINNNFREYDFKIIPTVFITNRTILKLPEEKIDLLAENIIKAINSYFELDNTIYFDEIQIDCDWSIDSRNKYFSLLKKIKKIIRNKTLSATIRLHQIKYSKKTGTPPVDRGMLMFYNMSSVSNIDTINSIYSESVAKQYLYNFDEYPLPLDVALPAFSWVVLFRNHHIVDLINEVNITELRDKDNFTLLKNNFYTPTREQFFRGNYLILGDILESETITPKVTLSAAKLISSYIKNNNLTVCIYHFHKEMKNEYTIKDLENIYTAFN